jgi:predicted nucleic acid-binding protein
MLIYLDNCCFNRPFDDQKQLRIRIETEAKLGIQEAVRSGYLDLAWSYILDFENENNPFLERQERTREWRRYAKSDSVESTAIKNRAESLRKTGLSKIDALHVACAMHAECAYFITTDDGILKKSEAIGGIVIVDPVDFVKKELT